MKMALVLACGALLASGAAFANNQGNYGTSNANGQGSAATSNGASRPEPAIAGVVTNVNGHELTLVVPAGSEVDVSRIGQSVYVERGVNLIAVHAPVQQSAKVFVDGQQSSLSNLKEGDVVRAAFDPGQQQFVKVSAVTPKEMQNDVNKARSDLRVGSSQARSANANSNPNSNSNSNR